MPTPRRMRFDRFGRAYHLRIQSAEDLRFAAELDPALWTATAAPISTLRCDETFLRLVDSDGNGLILHHELRDAIRWALRLLKDPSGLDRCDETLTLDSVNTNDEEGRVIVESAREMLRIVGRWDAAAISLQEVRSVKSTVTARPVSEAGVVLPQATEDAALGAFIRDILATVGGVPHPSGAQGVDVAKLDEFLRTARAFLEWRARGTVPPDGASTGVMPLGPATPSAFAALTALEEKLEQYFAQCELLVLDSAFSTRVGWKGPLLEEADLSNATAIDSVLRKAPLAPPRPDSILDFDGPMNPAWRESVRRFRSQVVQPILGEVTTFDRAQWQSVKEQFQEYRKWLAAKPQAPVDSIGEEKLRQYVEGPLPDALRALAATGASTAFVLKNIRQVEKLVLYQRWLMALANNFVSFPDLYHQAKQAMFERGALVIDGRWLRFSVLVEDRATHSLVAKAGNMFLIYVETSRPGVEKPLTLALPVTSGTRGNLSVGKRGVFVDVQGRQWDARVVQVIENPVSLVEALVSPFKRLGAFVGGKIESLTTTAEQKMEQVVGGVVSGQPPPAPAAGRGNMLMGIGFTVAALGSAFAFITKQLSSIEHAWKIGVGVGAAILAITLPTTIVAVMKLRRRDLSAILEGCGWAVNTRMRLTGSLGRFFTRRPPFPKGAQGTPWRRRLIGVIIAVLIGALVAALAYWLVARGAAVPPLDAASAEKTVTAAVEMATPSPP